MLENYIPMRVISVVGDTSSYYLTNKDLEDPLADPILLEKVAYDIAAYEIHDVTHEKTCHVFYRGKYYQIESIKLNWKGITEFKYCIVKLPAFHAGFINGMDSIAP